MKPIVAIVFIVALATSAHAQQSPRTPTQTALQIDTVVNEWAQTLEAQAHEIADLQKKVTDLQQKYEPKDKK